MKIFTNKAFLDEKISKRNGHLSLLEKNYNKFKKHYNKQTAEEILTQRAVKTTIQTLYDKGFPNAIKVFKDFLFVTRLILDSNDDVNDDLNH